MPLLARTITAPLVVDVRPGVMSHLAAVLTEQRISPGGRVAVAVAASLAGWVTERLVRELPDAQVFPVRDGTVDGALRLAQQVGQRQNDALVGVGGGRVLDVAKYTGSRLGLPVVAVATNLAHDGIGSPVSILDNDGGRGSYGVPPPIAVLVDLDVVRGAPVRSVRAGVGETVSNVCAIADWQLAHTSTGEPLDGLAVMLARSAAHAVLHNPGSLDDDAFLATLAESLVLSGMAMVVAGTSRPCSGACHEISHAVDLLYPDRDRYHGEQVGLGAAFATWLRQDSATLDVVVTTLRRHGLPVLPTELGLTDAEFTRVVVHAPQTRPGRHTILEELGLGEEEIQLAVKDYVHSVS